MFAPGEGVADVQRRRHRNHNFAARHRHDPVGHLGRADGQAGPFPGTFSAGLSEASTTISTRPWRYSGKLRAGAAGTEEDPVDTRDRRVPVGADAAGGEGVHRLPVLQLSQMHVVGGFEDPTEHRLALGHVVADAHGRGDVPVLEGRAGLGVDLNPIRRHDPDDARADGVDRSGVGGRDVDPLVVGERTGARHEAVNRGRAVEHRARIGEVPANRVLAVERLDGPAVGVRPLGAGPSRRRRRGRCGGECRPACQRAAGHGNDERDDRGAAAPGAASLNM